ncbi:Peroxiredoxin [Candidatus Trichorickettsia mobilis]|uniref:Peroxiredoxin n=1 Tax=Candidatus Trichorickettsia mobilis TaxID=1346319 RepID=A0ABZ0UTP7_9RICK|nr:peroxiredoxin [Candidatus Trichorickettsia mobilis]WPY00565.1 Peroxiredoxin [Candidatus Trichorickettsia mobilis]
MQDTRAFVGKVAPDFTAKAIMPDNTIELSFNLKNYTKGHKAVIFFYPLDFTFVCPSEIIAFNNRLGEFSSRNTKLIAVSVDSHFSHLAWKNTPNNKGGVGNIQIPMVSDINKEISCAYNVLNDDGISLRGTFLLDELSIIRHLLVNDLPLGRSVEETLRIIDALEFHSTNGEVCPAGWHKGDEGMTPSQKGVADYLTSNADKL